MAFELATAEFTGPIELLLELIERRKLPINDVSLAYITDEYLRYATSLTEGLPINQRIQFVYIASTLALIKSKSLLPKLDLTPEEESDIERLKERLALYQFFQQVANTLAGQIDDVPSFHQTLPGSPDIFFAPHDSLTQVAYDELLRTVLNEVPKPIPTKQEGYIRLAVHIEEIMEMLIQRVQSNLSSFRFSNFLDETVEGGTTNPKEKRIFTVVSFLALLEVVRNHGVLVSQETIFEEITVGEKVGNN